MSRRSFWKIDRRVDVYQKGHAVLIENLPAGFGCYWTGLGSIVDFGYWIGWIDLGLICDCWTGYWTGY